MHLDSLKEKEIDISNEEHNSVMIAILLHDLEHGPFSHTLESSLLSGVKHEKVSLWMMQHLNREFNGELDLAIKIFENKYHRPFFYQLVSGQLNIDRLDYLKRDSFFSGVREGFIDSERIIKRAKCLIRQGGKSTYYPGTIYISGETHISKGF